MATPLRLMTRISRLDDFRDVPTDDPPPPPEHSWRPLSLIQLAATPPEPPTIGGLLYPGKRTVLSGETESMKTWLALILAKAELDLGKTVGWVDLDAMGAGAMLERLTLLGVTEQTIDERFLYYEPSDMLDPSKKLELTETITDRKIRLFVIDAFNPILNLHGLDMNSTKDIETFWVHIADPICKAGAACTVLDHVAKNTETRGKYSIGSERKASGAIVHIGFRLLEPLTRGGKGRSLLTVHKDRPGCLPRPTLGRLTLTSDNQTIDYTLEQDHAHDTDRFRPTILMERISQKLELHGEPVSKTWIEENTDGQAKALRTAVDVLVDEGYVARTAGPNKSQFHTVIRSYRQSNDDPPTSPSPVRPQSVPSLRSSESVPPSPYVVGTGTVRDGDGDGDGPSPHHDGDPISEYDIAPPDDSLYDPDREPEPSTNGRVPFSDL